MVSVVKCHSHNVMVIFFSGRCAEKKADDAKPNDTSYAKKETLLFLHLVLRMEPFTFVVTSLSREPQKTPAERLGPHTLGQYH